MLNQGLLVSEGLGLSAAEIEWSSSVNLIVSSLLLKVILKGLFAGMYKRLCLLSPAYGMSHKS